MSTYPKHDEDFYGWALHTAQLLKDRKMNEAMEEGFLDSKIIIEKDTPLNLNILPSSCPYTFDQMMDDTFYPDAS